MDALTDWAWLLLVPPAALLAYTLGQSFGAYVVMAAERGTPVRFSTRSLTLWAREGVSRALFITLSPLGWMAADRVPGGPVPGERAPVLLVPDYKLGPASLVFLRLFLVQRGWERTALASHRSVDLPLSEMATDLGARVEALSRESGADRVELVAHGLGGLAAAWYLRHLEGHRRVRRLVTLGTPWSGTRMAVFGRGRSCRDMDPGTPVLDGLAPPPVPTACIWSPDDPFVVPHSSALPDGVESVRIDHVGHADMLVSGRVFRAVDAALSHAITAGIR